MMADGIMRIAHCRMLVVAGMPADEVDGLLRYDIVFHGHALAIRSAKPATRGLVSCLWQHHFNRRCAGMI